MPNAQLIWGDHNTYPIKLFLYLENGRRMCVGCIVCSSDVFLPLPRHEFEDAPIEPRRYRTKEEAMRGLAVHTYEVLYVLARPTDLGLIEPWRVCYRMKDLDDRDVVTGYYGEEEARKQFDETSKWSGLEFVRLEKNGVSADYFAP